MESNAHMSHLQGICHFFIYKLQDCFKIIMHGRNNFCKESMANSKTISVVMIPCPAFGHLIPFFQLSIALAKAGVRVFFISTPRNIQRLPQVPPKLLSLLKFVKIPLPELDNELLPKGAEATVDVPWEKIQCLVNAYDLLRHPIKKFVADQSPDYIVVDFAADWAVDIAAECQVPLLYFSVYSSSTSVFFGPPEYMDGQGQVRPSPESLTSPPQWVDFPSLVAYREFEAIEAYNTLYCGSFVRFAKVLHACQAVAIRSCMEFEGNYLIAQQKMMRPKPVIPIGLLPPPQQEKTETVGVDESWGKIFQWLDEQESKTTVFVCFGSECKLTREQVHEIAYGIELSRLPFLWALRKPHWAPPHDEEVNVALPQGFTKRTSKQGHVYMGWAPQVEILKHPAIGGILFHSGWGSVIESLQFGHCLVLLPFIHDQALNARMLVEKGLAIEIERSRDGSFSSQNIADSVRKAMLSEEGQQLRDKARKVSSVFSDQKLHQDHYISGFVKYLNHQKGITQCQPKD